MSTLPVGHGPDPSGSPYPVWPTEPEVSLADLVMPLWRARLWIIVAAIACGALAYAWGKLAPPLYEADVTLLANRSQEQLSPTALANLEVLIHGRSVAAQLLAELGSEMPEMDLDGIIDATTVSTPRNTSLLQVKMLLGSPDLAARAANRIAELAVERNRALNQEEAVSNRDRLKQQRDIAAARLEELEIAMVDSSRRGESLVSSSRSATLNAELRRVVDQRVSALRQIAEQQANDATARLAEANEQLTAFRQAANLPRLQALLEARLKQLSELTIAQNETRAERLSIAARIDESRIQLAAVPKLLEAPSPLSPGEYRENALSPWMNPTYQVIEQQLLLAEVKHRELETRIAENEATLAVAEAEAEQLQTNLAAGRAQEADLQLAVDLARTEFRDLMSESPAGLAALLESLDRVESRVRGQLLDVEREIVALQVDQDRLDTEHAIALAQYRDLATRFGQAETDVISRSVDLQIIDRAVPPDRKAYPRTLLNTALALILGLMGASMIVLLLHFIRGQQVDAT